MSKRKTTVYAYVQFDHRTITEIVGVECMTVNDSRKVPIKEKGVVVCARCEKVAG